LIKATWNESEVSDIKKAFDKVPEAYKEAASEVAARLHRLAIGRTTYVTGHLQRGWSEVQESITAGGLSFAFDNAVDYGPVLELGKYPVVGLRTIEAQTQAGATGIFSKGTVKDGVGGMLGPSFDKDVLEDLGKMVVGLMSEAMKNA